MKPFRYLQRKFHNLTHPVLGRILMLHRVVEHRSEGENGELEVTPDFLEQTINDYHRQGYRFVSINDACDIIGRGCADRPFVCVTFDDGYRDNYTNALPLLKREQVPFAVYVTTGFIDNRQPMWWYPGEQLGLSLEELLALDAEPLCTIGVHTITHPKLDSLALEEQRHEIVQSRRELENLLGHPLRHFSYPHGAYNNDTIALIEDCGFRSALMAWGGAIRRGDDSLLLHRIFLKQP